MSHYEDEAEVEQLRRWWQENWRPLLAGLMIGLAGILGWQGWQDYKTRKAEESSQIYEDLKKALVAGKSVDALQMAGRLQLDYARTPYAAHAALLLAQQAADRKDWDTARIHLTWVVEHGRDQGLRMLGRLRLARVLWQLGKPDEALAQLEVKDAADYAPLYEELKGDIKYAQGDRAAARTAYEKALQLGGAPASQELLRRKLDDLADAAPANS